MNTQQTDLFSFNEVQVTYHSKQLGPYISNSRDAFEFMQARWPNIDYCERMYVLLLNKANKILGVKLISEGSVAGTVADPKKIFQIALKANASSIIMAHNHPSASLQPSRDDTRITEKCKQAGLFLDLPVLDHIILTNDQFYSFSDEGLL